MQIKLLKTKQKKDSRVKKIKNANKKVKQKDTTANKNAKNSLFIKVLICLLIERLTSSSVRSQNKRHLYFNNVQILSAEVKNFLNTYKLLFEKNIETKFKLIIKMHNLNNTDLKT